jgi:hypothetical protein
MPRTAEALKEWRSLMLKIEDEDDQDDKDDDNDQDEEDDDEDDQDDEDDDNDQDEEDDDEDEEGWSPRAERSPVLISKRTPRGCPTLGCVGCREN